METLMWSLRLTGRSAGLGRALTLAAVLFAGCRGERAPQASSAAAKVAADVPAECKAIAEMITPRVKSLAQSAYRLTGEIIEYQDCQRFISSGKYGDALYAIVPVDKLDLLWQHVVAHPESAYNFALIWTDSGNYPSLSLRQGINCLYLFQNQRPTRLKAFVTQGAPCQAVTQPQESPLTVTRFPVSSDLQAGDVPAVARWDRDSKTGEYIIVKCGDNSQNDGWCAIGGLGSSHYMAPGGGQSHEARRIAEIGLWYDEQELAIPDPGNGNKVKPSGITGTIFPRPDLEDLGDTDFTSQWQLVGLVTVSKPYKKLFEKTSGQGPPSLAVGDGGVSANRIEICAGSLSTAPAPGCAIPSGVAWPSRCPDSQGPGDWWVRIVGPSKNVIHYGCVNRTPHPNMTIPGTVRWHWSAIDEQAWGRCGGGCCTIY